MLFDDLNDRTVNGVDYSDAGIGFDLRIRNIRTFKDPTDTHSGDGIEVNCPSYRFRGVVVENCHVHGTKSSPSVGIGMGFANCDDILISGCFVDDVESQAGGIHAEYCENFTLSHFARPTTARSGCRSPLPPTPRS